MILMHVIRNAQDATDSDGFIDVTFTTDQDYVLIEIEDNDCGREKDFLRNRLFKPVELTKSSMGMRIGAHQVTNVSTIMGSQFNAASE
mgnify:CR=1 FL=1